MAKCSACRHPLAFQLFTQPHVADIIDAELLLTLATASWTMTVTVLSKDLERFFLIGRRLIVDYLIDFVV